VRYQDFPADKAGLKPDEITQIGDVLLSDFKDDAPNSERLKKHQNRRNIRQENKYGTNCS
jgi:carboxyl-terminal processing protease